MKTIGMIGGMSWESSQNYYRIINERIKKELGGLHSAKILLYSVDFAEIERCQARNEWDKAGIILTDVARRLEIGGADFIIVCTNTMHKIADQISKGISIPLLHIADATAERLRKSTITRVGLIGTRYTMTEDFYRGKLESYGIEALVPDKEEMATVNSIIFNELCMGIVRDESREKYLKVIGGLAAKGAQGIILGCTEIGMLIEQKHVALPVFDTTVIHAQKAAELAVSGE